MTRVDAIESLADENIVTLECGHKISTTAPQVCVGMPWDCPECRAERLAGPEPRRETAQPLNDAQITAVAEHYAETMRALGFDVPDNNMPILKRAAAIQDAWRVAFARVLA